MKLLDFETINEKIHDRSLIVQELVEGRGGREVGVQKGAGARRKSAEARAINEIKRENRILEGGGLNKVLCFVPPFSFFQTFFGVQLLECPLFILFINRLALETADISD